MRPRPLRPGRLRLAVAGGAARARRTAAGRAREGAEERMRRLALAALCAASAARAGVSVPLAALHLERSLFLDPSDDDARADLLEVRRGNVDKLEGEAEDGGAEAVSRVLAPLPGRPAAVAVVALWTLGWGLLTANFLRPRAALGTSAAACFILAGAAALVTAGSAAAHRLTLRRAVVVAQAAPAREGPSDRAASHFEVHEGTALRIEDEDHGFRRVKLANGLTGWVPSAAVEPVVPAGWSNQRRL